LRLITAQQFIKEKTTKNKNKNSVSTASGAQTGNAYFFEHSERREV
jgi:hypothetical protein